MLRRFASVNSIPNYRAEHNKDNGKLEFLAITPANTDSTTTPPHLEYQYLNLIYDILEENHEHNSRNGSTFSIFGAGMVFSLEQGLIPILTTKQMAWKTCLKELLWFIQGKTDNRLLNTAGVHIWDDNA